ncbi:hypothetical protein LCGC14_0909670 [marine sediment metagenome]|uniref:Uncharacterized protein n=1 Tax=marine sediment metagenome TaxID=412755 RepID=A0A0F9NYM6_9ZZZZ
MAISQRHRGWRWSPTSASSEGDSSYLAALYNGTEAYRILGTGINFAGTTLTPDSNRADIALAVGTRAAEKDITMTAAASQHLEPIQINLNFSGAAPTSTSTVNALYMQLTHDTIDMANLRLKGADWTFTINKDLQDAYVYQGEIDYGAAASTVGGESAVMSLNMNAGAGAVTGNLRGLIVNTYGAGLPSTTSIGIEVRTDGGSATLAEGIRIWSVGANSITAGLNFTGTLTYFADFDGCSGAATTITTDSGSVATTWKARIKVKTDDGTDAWINVYSTSNE